MHSSVTRHPYTTHLMLRLICSFIYFPLHLNKANPPAIINGPTTRRAFTQSPRDNDLCSNEGEIDCQTGSTILFIFEIKDKIANNRSNSPPIIAIKPMICNPLNSLPFQAIFLFCISVTISSNSEFLLEIAVI